MRSKNRFWTILDATLFSFWNSPYILCSCVNGFPSDGSNGYWGFLLLPDVRSILVYVISFVWVFSVIVMAVISACGTLGMLGVCFCLERGLIPFFLERRDFVCTFISSLVRLVILSEWAAPENDFSNGRTPACQRVRSLPCVLMAVGS